MQNATWASVVVTDGPRQRESDITVAMAEPQGTPQQSTPVPRSPTHSEASSISISSPSPRMKPLALVSNGDASGNGDASEVCFHSQ